jgi:nucleoid-associated protein YgaU
VALGRLRAANPKLRDPNRIAVGDVVRVPQAAPARRARQGGNG